VSDSGVVRQTRYRQTEKGQLATRRESRRRTVSGQGAELKAAQRERQRYELASVLVEPELRHPVNNATVVAVLGDQQIPFEDPAAMDAALEVVAAVKADTVILNGDVVDCYAESVFLKDWKLAALATKESHIRARRYMECFEQVPQKIWLGGNHEERWKKELWREIAKGDKAGAIASNLVAAMQAKGVEIDLGDPVGSFERIYSMGEHGFKFYPYHHRLYLAEGNLVVTHGEYVRKDAGAAARATYEWLGKSVIVGHTHRLGSYYRKTDEKEHGGWEGGCLCQLEPEYCTTPNWQQGLTLVRIDGPEFHVIPVPIIRRRGKPVAVYQGE
jgi:hypothetical protein